MDAIETARIAPSVFVPDVHLNAYNAGAVSLQHLLDAGYTTELNFSVDERGARCSLFFINGVPRGILRMIQVDEDGWFSPMVFDATNSLSGPRTRDVLEALATIESLSVAHGNA